jgi:hypothetical protein
MVINRVSAEIIVDDDDLRNLGFTKVSTINRNIIINFGDGRPTILSKFNIDDLEGSLKSLQKKLINNGISEESAQRFTVFLADKLVKIIEQELQNEGSAASNTDVQKITQEIAKDKVAIGQLSVEQWQSGVLERYQILQKVVQENLPNLWPALEFALSIKTILNIKDCTLPFAGILLGSPSSLKTVSIELFRKWPQTYYTDNFSAKSFVSHSTAVTREELVDIDMLPKIKNKLFLTPELAPTFAAKEDDLIQVLGIMTRILDGHGYENDTGAHGHRGYNEEMMFSWIGAAVDMPYKVHKYLATLGPKLYFLRLPRLTKSEDDYYKQLDDDFGKKLKEMQKALFEYLKYFEIGTEAIVVVENGLPKVSCNSAKDDELTKRCIVRLGRLLSRLRGVVPTWHTQDTQGSDYAYGIATIEEPDRAITQLRNLARGHALSQGRNYITSQDLPIVIKVVLSTASIERVTIFDILISNKGRLTTTQITTSLNITPHTAHRTMVELNALGLVDMPSIGDKPNTEKQIIIKSEFGWFLSEEFTQLREAFVPEDNSDVQYKQETKQLEEKIPLSSQENNDSDSIVVKDNDGIMERKLEENLPLTNANLIPFNQQQLEEKSTLTTSNYDSGKHEEKITNITQKINNNNRQQIGIENIEVVGGEFFFKLQ